MTGPVEVDRGVRAIEIFNLMADWSRMCIRMGARLPYARHGVGNCAFQGPGLDGGTGCPRHEGMTLSRRAPATRNVTALCAGPTGPCPSWPSSNSATTPPAAPTTNAASPESKAPMEALRAYKSQLSNVV